MWRPKFWEPESYQDLFLLAMHYFVSQCHSLIPRAGLDFALAIIRQTRNFVTNVLILHADSSSLRICYCCSRNCLLHSCLRESFDPAQGTIDSCWLGLKIFPLMQVVRCQDLTQVAIHQNLIQDGLCLDCSQAFHPFFVSWPRSLDWLLVAYSVCFPQQN